VFVVLVILRAINLHCHLWPIKDLELFSRYLVNDANFGKSY